MTGFKLIRLKNAMLFSNFISNLVGVAVVVFLTERSRGVFTPEILEVAHRINLFYLPLSFILPWALTLLYERPVRKYLASCYARRPQTEEAVLRARQRLLNEPFFLIILSFGTWLTAATLYSCIFWAHGATSAVIRITFFRGFYTGLITITVAFFVSEYVLQRRLAPLFFPEGGLTRTPGTLRVRIGTRLTVLLLASNLIPLIIIFDGIWRISGPGGDLYPTLEQSKVTMLIEVLIFMGVGVWLTFLVSSNLTRPLKEIVHVLQRVKIGLFAAKVRVSSNDEIGYTGDVINEMTEGLLERDRLQQSLMLAGTIQENLLPRGDFEFPGLEIAGKSIYCDETGGDFYDFFRIGEGASQRVGVVIADVSGHGVSSALLMATVRSSLRQRASLPGSAGEIVEGVNRQLVQDVERSGDFATMFFMVIDPANNELEWVRAGHDPAMFYDPATDSFHELDGKGVALGIDGQSTYQSSLRNDFSEGRILFLGTDGVWEAQNEKGEMLGKAPILDVIRSSHSSSARALLDAILERVARHQNVAAKEDDITMVVVKSSLHPAPKL